MGKSDTEQVQAAYALSDDLLHMRLQLERAETALEEVTDGYFRPYDTSTEEGKFCILYGHRKHELFCDIVSDYLFDIRKTLDRLAEWERKGSELAKDERESVKA